MLLETDDVGVAFLADFVEGLVEVNIGGFLIGLVVFFCVFGDAGGTQGHEAVL